MRKYFYSRSHIELGVVALVIFLFIGGVAYLVSTSVVFGAGGGTKVAGEDRKFEPGEEQNPDNCSPGDANCTVDLGWTLDVASKTLGTLNYDVGIGTTQPAALLDLNSSTSTLALSRLSDPASNVASPLNGMLAYNSTANDVRSYINAA